MTGAQAFGADEARFTPITVAGVLAIIGLSVALAASVLQGGAGRQSLSPRLGSGTAPIQAAPAVTSVGALQPAAVPLTSGQPAISAAGAPAAGGVTAPVAGPAAVGAGTVAPIQASGSSQSPASIAATSVPATRSPQVTRAAGPEAAPAGSAVPQFNTNAASAATGTVGATGRSGSAILQATEAQVLGSASTTATGSSFGISPAAANPATAVQPSTGFATTGAPGSAPTSTDPPFPNIKPYTGPITQQSEAYQALGLPADFQFGGEPDPYVAGSYASFVRDAAAGDQAAQAGLDLAMSQGANFAAFH